jgi:hypothetical protein
LNGKYSIKIHNITAKKSIKSGENGRNKNKEKRTNLLDFFAKRKSGIESKEIMVRNGLISINRLPKIKRRIIIRFGKNLSFIFFSLIKIVLGNFIRSTVKIIGKITKKIGKKFLKLNIYKKKF